MCCTFDGEKKVRWCFFFFSRLDHLELPRHQPAMAAFSTPDTAALERTVTETTTLGASGVELLDAYEIERTSQQILEGGYTRVSRSFLLFFFWSYGSSCSIL
jgi:hypothetical protein